MYQVSLSTDDLPIDTDAWINLKVDPQVSAILSSQDPLPREMARGPEKVIQAEFNVIDEAEAPLRLGLIDDVGLEIRAGTKGVVDIVWPEEDQSPIASYDQSLGPDQLYLLLTLEAEAHFDAKTMAALPSYPLSGTLGLQSGANVHYSYMKRFPSDRSASAVVREFFSGLRMPQNIRTADDLPAPGEVVGFRYGGYLTIGLDTAWGYTVQQFEELDFGDLDLKHKLSFTSSLDTKVNCGISGDFSLEVQRDPQREGWARVVVRKRRRRSSTAALDLKVGVRPEMEGLPEDASKFIEAMLGLTVPQQVEEIRQMLEENKLDEYLRNETRALTTRLIRELFEQWYPDDSIEDKAAPFVETLTQALEKYDEIKQLDDRLVDAASTFSANQLEDFLSQLQELQERSDLTEITAPLFWKILRSIAGEDYADIIQKDATFAERKTAIEEKLTNLLSREKARLLDFLSLSQAVLSIDRLVNELQKYDSVEELKAEAEAHLLDLAERLTDRAFDEIDDRENLREAFDDLRQLLRQIDELKARTYEKFQWALERSYRATLGRSYARARENESLLDVRIDLTGPQGQKLMQEVLHGNFSRAMRREAVNHAEIVTGRFTEISKQTSRLKVNVLNWQYTHFRELAFHHDESLHQDGDRLIHVYQLSGEERETWQRRKESIQFTFMAGLLAEGRQAPQTRPDLIDVIRQMSFEYGFAIDDARVTDREMETYLALAQYLDLLPAATPTHLYIDELRADLGLQRGDSWGRVSMKYQVAYDSERLLNLFVKYDPDGDQRLVRSIYRQVAASNFRRTGRSADRPQLIPTSHAAVARGLLSSEVYESYNSGRLAGKVSDRLARNILETLFQIEKRVLLKALNNLHEAVAAQRVRKNKVIDAFQKLVELRDDLEQFLTVEERDRVVNPFFAIVDRLMVAKFADAREHRNSYAELEIVKGERELFRILSS